VVRHSSSDPQIELHKLRCVLSCRHLDRYLCTSSGLDHPRSDFVNDDGHYTGYIPCNDGAPVREIAFFITRKMHIAHSDQACEPGHDNPAFQRGIHKKHVGLVMSACCF
jgi:hypothetical protein